MISKLWTLYLRINYCAQRISPSFFVPRSIINTVMFEISFLTSGFLIVAFAYSGIKNKVVVGIVAFCYIILLWQLFAKRIANVVYRRLDELEEYYISINNLKHGFYFVLAIYIVVCSTFFMIYSAAEIVKMGNS